MSDMTASETPTNLELQLALLYLVANRIKAGRKNRDITMKDTRTEKRLNLPQESFLGISSSSIINNITVDQHGSHKRN